MTRRLLSKAIFVLTAVNLMVAIFNLSAPSKAAVGALTYRDLIDSADFTRAVQSVVQACSVNVDTAKVKC
jgi:hypothetical protein